MAEEIVFENCHFWNFKSHATLTLTSDDLESHIVVNESSTITNTTVWFVAALCFTVDVRMDVRRDRQTFLPGLLCHLSWDDLKTEVAPDVALQRPEMRMVRWMYGIKVRDRVPSWVEREMISSRYYSKTGAMVWACAAKRRQWLGEEMYGVWSLGRQTKRQTKEDLDTGCAKRLPDM